MIYFEEWFSSKVAVGLYFLSGVAHYAYVNMLFFQKKNNEMDIVHIIGLNMLNDIDISFRIVLTYT